MKIYHGGLEVVENPMILVDQYLFHTEKALTTLHFIEAFKIGR